MVSLHEFDTKLINCYRGVICILVPCCEVYRDEKKIIYELEDPSFFSKTDYLLQFSNLSFFLPCYKFQKNGVNQFLFVTEEFLSLAVWMKEMDSDLFVILFSKIISKLIQVKQNDLIYSTNIVLNWNSIFVDIKNYEVYFLYLPIVPSRNCIMIEQVLIKMLEEVIESTNNLKSYNFFKFHYNLNRSLLPLEQWLEHLEIKNTTNETQASDFVLQGKNLPVPMEILIFKKDYLIGKLKGEVDIDLSFNPAVSRRHCKIVYTNDIYYIVDLESKNGTFLNQNRLQANKKNIMKPGDELRIASSCFKVRKGRSYQ